MATDIVQSGPDPVGRDVLTAAQPAQGENAKRPQADPYVGIAAEAFTSEQTAELLREIDESDIEIRPDGLIYLPEIKYRRILNRTLGPGAWALMPRSIDIGDNVLYYRGALFIHGRFVSEAIGEQPYFPNNDRMSYATAAEAAKSNCLVRCCKDIGIASELWDPTFTRQWRSRNAVEVWCVNRQDPNKRKKFWRKADAPLIDTWPWREMEDSPSVRQEPGPVSAPVNRQSAPGAPLKAAAARIAPVPVEPVRPPLGGPFGDVRLISPRQAGRFRAIARAHGWRERELHRLLAQHRVAGVDDITRDIYEELCNRLIDDAHREAIRAEIESDRPADDIAESLLR